MSIHRITMFKIPDSEAQEKTIEAYKKLDADNKKDGKSYISDISAYKLHDDPRSQGFTIAAKTVFASVSDMKYYDEKCEAHDALKGVVRPLAQGMMMIYYDA